jgi:glyoxylase-like metal-dependent hydrolase (beta-lactamase superfamily II)
MDDAFTAASWFAGLPDAVTRQPPGGWFPELYRLTPAPLTETLDEGDVVDLGDRRLRVLHLPGHSPGCIGLLDEANGEFFAADAIYDAELYDELPHSNVGDYLDTMRRLLTLDVGVVHGGHGPSFGRQRMREIARDYIARRG